jgi:hypothetical protein
LRPPQVYDENVSDPGVLERARAASSAGALVRWSTLVDGPTAAAGPPAAVDGWPSYWTYEGWIADLSVDDRRSKIVRGIARILTFCGPLSAQEVLDAWQRQSRLAGFVPLPDAAEVLEAWAQAHPRFGTTPCGESGCGVLLHVFGEDCAELDGTTSILYEALKDEPNGLSRSSLRQRCIDLGMKPATFAVGCTYSPILVHGGRDLWALRRHGIALPLAASQRPRKSVRAVTSWTWSSDGALVLAARLNGAENFVLNIPAAIRIYLEDREFVATGRRPAAASSRLPQDLGVVRVRNGTSWGYSRFLSYCEAQPGDCVEAHFDLSAGVVELVHEVAESGCEARRAPRLGGEP